MLHQVYLNGRFAGVTIDVEQRQLVVQSPGSFQSALRVEVVAVEPKDAHMDFADELDPPPAAGRVRLSILRSQTLPPGAGINVYFDNGAGQIDYDAAAECVADPGLAVSAGQGGLWHGTVRNE